MSVTLREVRDDDLEALFELESDVAGSDMIAFLPREPGDLLRHRLVGYDRSDQIVRLHRDTASPLTLEAFMQQHVDNARVPLGRMGEAAEFARIACFLDFLEARLAQTM